MTRWKTVAVKNRVGGQTRTTTGRRKVVVPRPLARWDFDATSGPWLSADGDLPLSAIRGTPTRVDTPWGSGLDFDGSAALGLAAASIGRLNIGAAGKNTVTVAAWVNSRDANTGYIAGVWQEDNNDPRRQYGLFYDLQGYGGSKRVCMHASRYGGATPGYPFSRDYSATFTQYDNDKWNLMVGTYDGSVITSYLNGYATSYPKYTDPLGNTYVKNPYDFPLGLNSAPADFTVGACKLTSGFGNYAIGTFARIRVWDIVLTPQQILEMYKIEKPAY